MNNMNYWNGTNIPKSKGNAFDWRTGKSTFAIELQKINQHKTSQTNPETGKLEVALAYRKSIVIPPKVQPKLASKKSI